MYMLHPWWPCPAHLQSHHCLGTRKPPQNPCQLLVADTVSSVGIIAVTSVLSPPVQSRTVPSVCLVLLHLFEKFPSFVASTACNIWPWVWLCVRVSDCAVCMEFQSRTPMHLRPFVLATNVMQHHLVCCREGGWVAILPLIEVICKLLDEPPIFLLVALHEEKCCLKPSLSNRCCCATWALIAFAKLVTPALASSS